MPKSAEAGDPVQTTTVFEEGVGTDTTSGRTSDHVAPEEGRRHSESGCRSFAAWHFAQLSVFSGVEGIELLYESHSALVDLAVSTINLFESAAHTYMALYALLLSCIHTQCTRTFILSCNRQNNHKDQQKSSERTVVPKHCQATIKTSHASRHPCIIHHDIHRDI